VEFKFQISSGCFFNILIATGHQRWVYLQSIFIYNR